MRWRLRLVGVLLLFLAAAAFCFADIRKPTVEIDGGPPEGPMIVKVRINGQDAKMEIDSGCPNVRIQPSSAIRLGLVPVGFKLPKDGNQRLATTIDLGGGQQLNIKVDVSHMFVDDSGKDLDYQDYDGLLGLSVLQTGAIGLDFASRKVAFWPGGLLSPDDVQAWIGSQPMAAPLSMLNFAGWDYYRVPAVLDGKGGDFILDTGSPNTILTQGEATLLRKERSFDSGLPFIGFNGSAGFRVVESLDLPWRSLATPIVSVLSRRNRYAALIGSGTTAGLIGFDSLEGTRTIIDFPKRQAYGAVCADWIAWDDWLGSFGFRLVDVTVGDHASYAGFLVAAGGAAARAGIKDTDQAVEIEGQAATLDLHRSPPAGWKPKAALTLKYRRNGKDFDVTLQR